MQAADCRRRNISGFAEDAMEKGGGRHEWRKVEDRRE
jgi:hypothetical protein